MPKFSKAQFETLAQLFGNAAVAWFTVGVITPIFVPGFDLRQQAGTIVFGLGFALAFTAFAMIMAGRIKK